ncbi:MAG: nucleoside phosphorylase [Alistipes sp.]|nr:nucleoside phosphorylase [Candidatus Alistipes equi]
MKDNRVIPASELVINDDGTIFHLHLRPEDISDKIILVGDPGRVKLVASFFSKIEKEVSSREFCTVTGLYKGERLTVISTGIGPDNIDITVTELDALANIDFSTRMIKEKLTSLTLLRLGTSGALQPDIKIGDFVFARTSIGFDGVLNFYEGRDSVCNLEMEKKFVEHVGWSSQLSSPYFIDASKRLFDMFKNVAVDGITIAAPGFYGPQGRFVRIAPRDVNINEKICSFRWNERRITNYEMESSALAGLSALMGHEAGTMCTIIAQRAQLGMCTDYHPFIKDMVYTALEKLVENK